MRGGEGRYLCNIIILANFSYEIIDFDRVKLKILKLYIYT
jgi:hypothetical protein